MVRFFHDAIGEEAREQIRAVTAQSNEALADVRRIVAATRALSPGEELEEARSLLEVARIDAEITNEGEPPSGPRSTAAAHVIREGVTNAILHARPSWVRVRLSPGGVTVTNDGYSASYAASSAGSGSGACPSWSATRARSRGARRVPRGRSRCPSTPKPPRTRPDSLRWVLIDEVWAPPRFPRGPRIPPLPEPRAVPESRPSQSPARSQNPAPPRAPRGPGRAGRLRPA